MLPMYKVGIWKSVDGILSDAFGKSRQVISGVIVAKLWVEKKRY